MGDITGASGTADKWLAEIWSKIPTVTYRSNVVLPPLMDRRWEPDLAKYGDTVHIPGFTFNTTTYVQSRSTFGTGATFTWQAATESEVQLVVNRMRMVPYRYPIEIAEQFTPGYVALLLEGAGEALALNIDNDLAADSTDGIDSFTTAVGTDNIDITEDNLLTCESNLAANNAPLSDRYAVVSPASRQSLFKIESVRSSLYAGSMGNLDGAKGRGYIGKWMTLNFYESNNLEAGSSGKKNGVFHKEAIALVEQQNVRVEQERDLTAGGFQEYLVWHAYGIKKVKDAFGNELDGK